MRRVMGETPQEIADAIMRTHVQPFADADRDSENSGSQDDFKKSTDAYFAARDAIAYAIWEASKDRG